MITKNKRKGRRIMQIILLIVLCLILVTCIIIPPSLGKTKPFLDKNGEVIVGSISEKIYVDINDSDLGIFIMAKDNTKPVLLFLGGGPGIPEYLLEQEYPSGLSDEFVVCYLEYRGTSLSYDPDISADTMTTKQYISDVVDVTNYLRERFNQDKIYLLGHSFGTYIGLKTAEQNPELFKAYIAMAQIADQKKSEILAYDYMVEQYKELDIESTVKEFENYPIHESDKIYQQYAKSSLRDNSMHGLGIGTMHEMESVISGIFFPSLRCTVYTPTERINIWRGKKLADSSPVSKDSIDFNAFEDVKKLSIPIYFLAGKFDYTCAYSLQKEYFELINAPLKGFYTFENSAHSPLFEEPDKALHIMQTDVLNDSNSLSE